MNSSSSDPVYPCIPKVSSSIGITLLFLGVPCHTLILTVLFKQYELFPRHKLLISLSISDNMQLSVIGLTMIASLMFGLDNASSACQAIRHCLELSSAVTHVAGSLSILALTAERYISCVYCLRAYAILSSKRVNIVLIGIWFVALLCGGLVFQPNAEDQAPMPIGIKKRLGLLTVCTTFFVSIILIIAQIRLYLISKAKLREDARAAKFGQDAEASDIRKRELKITLVATVVAAMYVICMLPTSCLLLTVYITGQRFIRKIFHVRFLFQALPFMNTLADPFVYGYGMPDTRRLLLRYYRAVKSQIFERFNVVSSAVSSSNQDAVVTEIKADTQMQTTSL